jgi:hypothetical protein
MECLARLLSCPHFGQAIIAVEPDDDFMGRHSPFSALRMEDDFSKVKVIIGHTSCNMDRVGTDLRCLYMTGMADGKNISCPRPSRQLLPYQ